MHHNTMQLHHLHSSSCASTSTVGLCSAVKTRQGRAFTSVVVRAGANGAENGRLTSEKQREIAKILLQTQKNMLELNNSRVKVQEELAMAHRRIADLERELERLRVEQAREQLEKAEQAAAAALAVAAPVLEQAPATPAQPQQAPAAAQAAPAYPPQQQQQVQQMQPPATNHHSPPPQQQQPQVVQQVVQPAAAAAAAAPAPPPQQAEPPTPAPPAIINLTYVSGWHNCFIHFKVDDKPWTQVPGTRLTTDKRDHNMKHIRIEGKAMEFVMTNGENDWDSPGRYTDKPKNYAITAPGNYRLKSGKLELLPHTTAQ